MDVEVWLDENKNVKAQCHIDGFEKPYPLDGSERGADELFTRLFDQQLPAEALIAANQKAAGGLLSDLRNAVGMAEAAQTSRDRQAATAALERLSEIRQQFEAKRDDAKLNEMKPEQRGRRRIETWLQFYERDAVSRFAEVMDEEQQEEVKRAIRTLRLQLSTGASMDELDRSLDELEDAVFSGPARPALQAWQWATTNGVPPALAKRLRSSANGLRDALIAKNEGLAASCCDELEKLLAEVTQSWEKWRGTGPVLEAGADLRVIRESKRRGN